MSIGQKHTSGQGSDPRTVLAKTREELANLVGPTEDCMIALAQEQTALFARCAEIMEQWATDLETGRSVVPAPLAAMPTLVQAFHPWAHQPQDTKVSAPLGEIDELTRLCASMFRENARAIRVAITTEEASIVFMTRLWSILATLPLGVPLTK